MEAQSRWTVWGLEASLAVTDHTMLPEAEEAVRAVVAEVDLACSRFRADSELMMLQPAMAGGVRVSGILRHLMERALFAARLTEGDVDPGLGADLDALGYGRGIISVPLSVDIPPAPPAPDGAGPAAPAVSRVPGWKRITLDGRLLTVPPDLRLDLGATAKAVAADLAAAAVHARLGCGVLVSLGGDLATAGPGPDVSAKPGPWQVIVQDLPSDPSQRIALEPGFALATSSTQKRRWTHAGAEVHHILDPRFGRPAEAIWRSVTVAAPTCLEANAYSTAAVVRGLAAPEWFRSEGIPARFVDRQGRTAATGGWPAESRSAGEVLSHG
ncbi:MAG TPA: FAD:protein FMN transferase [Arthrobacter sp.]|nr:FAD:protein FMN transferase [Arthrobacter sp.]